MAGDEGWAEPVEIVDGQASTTEIEGGRNVDWHRAVRTGAAVVAALSLLWIGRSMADERAQTEDDRCASELSNAMWRYENAGSRTGHPLDEPPIPTDVVERLAAQARDCGADVFADAIEFEYITTYQQDDD